MKKFLFLFACLIGCLTANTASAQSFTLLSPHGGTTDSVTDAGTNYLTKQINGAASVVTVQLVITKISGTAAGTAVLQGSINGTNYVTLHYATGGATTGSQNDSFTLTNVTTQSVSWVIAPSHYNYYRVSVTGSGTQLLRLAATAIKR